MIQGSTRKKLASASGCILEYIGDIAVMAGNRDERRRCWDYLNWLLKQRKGALNVDPKGRDDVLELPVAAGKAGRLSGKAGNVLRSIEKETSTFCFLTDHRGAADGESRDELMLIFGADKRNRYKAMDLMEDAMEGKYQPKGGGNGGGGGDRGGRGGSNGGRKDACHDFSIGKCVRGDKCRFSHESSGGGNNNNGGRNNNNGGGRDRDRSPRRDGRGGPDRGRGKNSRDRDRDRHKPYDGGDKGSRGGGGGGERRREEPGARPGEDPRYDRR